MHEVGTEMDKPVPANIVTHVQGASVRNALRRSIACLATDPTVNTAIVTDKFATGMDGITGMDAVAPYQKVVIAFHDMKSEGSVVGRLKQYFLSRVQVEHGTAAAKAFSKPALLAIEALGSFIFSDSKRISASDRVKIVAARFAYFSHYASKEEDGVGWLTPHVDAKTFNNFDVRVVHGIEGCATVTFDDADFITRFNHGKGVLQAKFAKESGQIDGWAGPQGTYTVMRGSSERALADGAKSCVHSHGLTRTTDYRRANIRYDLVLVS